MSFADKYYYESSTSEADYSLNSTNDLVVPRLLVNQAPWRKPEGARVKKKKKLVLYAAQISSWNEAQRIVAAERLAALKKQGFEIYLYKGGVVETLAVSSFASAHNFETTEVPNKIIIEQSAQHLNLSYDEFFVLSNQELNLLIAGDVEEYASYGTSSQLDLPESNLSMDSLNTLLELRKDTLTRLNLSGCLNLALDSIAKDISLPHLNELILGSKAEETPISVFNNKPRERHISLNPESIDRLVSSSAQLTSLDLSYCKSINPNVLDLIKKPDILDVVKLADCPVANDSLATFLGKLSKVKILQLGNEKDKPVDGPYRLGSDKKDFRLPAQAFEQLNSTSLEALTLKNAQISISSLEKILKNNAKNLKRLALVRCGGLSGEILKPLNLESLEELDLTSSNISTTSVEKLLSNAKKLKKTSFIG